MPRVYTLYASAFWISYTASMAHRTTIMLDQKKLARVRRVLGTKGIKETVERAFDEILAMELRKRHVERLVKQQGIDFGDDVAAAAWR